MFKRFGKRELRCDVIQVYRRDNKEPTPPSSFPEYLENEAEYQKEKRIRMCKLASLYEAEALLTGFIDRTLPPNHGKHTLSDVPSDYVLKREETIKIRGGLKCKEVGFCFGEQWGRTVFYLTRKLTYPPEYKIVRCLQLIFRRLFARRWVAAVCITVGGPKSPLKAKAL